MNVSTDFLRPKWADGPSPARVGPKRAGLGGPNTSLVELLFFLFFVFLIHTFFKNEFFMKTSLSLLEPYFIKISDNMCS